MHKDLRLFLDEIGFKNTDTNTNVSKRWRKLALRYHPNKPTGNAELFKRLSAGYDRYKINPSNAKRVYFSNNKMQSILNSKGFELPNVKSRTVRALPNVSLVRYQKQRSRAARKIQKEWRKKKAIRVQKKKRSVAARKIQKAWRKRPQKGKLPSNWPANLRTDDVPQYMKNYFNSKKNQLPLNTSKLTVNYNRCTSNRPEDKKPMMTRVQALVYMVALGLQQPKVKIPNRGLLCWHSTGSGKTCTAAAIMNAYWNSNKNIVYLTSIEAKVANPPYKFHDCIKDFFPKSTVAKKSKEQFARRVQFFSFAQMAHYLQLYRGSGKPSEKEKRSMLLDNAVLIIDEVQNLFRPLDTQRREHNALLKFLLKDTKKTKALNVFILTATPGDTPGEIVKLLNLVRDRRQPEITTGDQFKTQIKGLVSYLNTNNDRSRFPTVSFKQHKLPMSMNQYKDYAEAYQRDLKKNQSSYGPRFFSLARRYSSMQLRLNDPNTFSNKANHFLELIQEYPNHKHYLYSAFYEARGDQGIIGIQNLMIQLGWEKVTPAQAKQWMSNKNVTHAKRFCVLATTQLPDRKDGNLLVEMFNSKNNVDGKVCQVMLASQKFNEGLDLKAVRHIHVLEPLLSMGMRQQTIGRARRFCSHFQLPMTEWNVIIHDYISDYPLQLQGKGYQSQRRSNHAEIQERIQRKQNILSKLKGQRGKNMKVKRNMIMFNIKQNKKVLRQMKDNKTTFDKIPLIDEIISTKAIEESENQESMLQAMRAQSIDYKTLQSLHNNSN